MSKELREAIELLEEEAVQLDRWVDESLSGGYSTHQVTPMRDRATPSSQQSQRAQGTGIRPLSCRLRWSNTHRGLHRFYNPIFLRKEKVSDTILPSYLIMK